MESPRPNWENSIIKRRWINIKHTAIVTEKVAVITRPGDSRRLGGEIKIKEVLSKYKSIEDIEHPGNIDGGDVLRVEDHFFVGLSNRTNEEGTFQLGSILSKYDYTSSMIPVKKALHLKSGANYIGNNNLVITNELADINDFIKFNKILINDDESYSANCLLVNDFLLIPKGYPYTKEKLMASGYHVLEPDVSEFRKMDGGVRVYLEH